MQNKSIAFPQKNYDDYLFTCLRRPNACESIVNDVGTMWYLCVVSEQDFLWWLVEVFNRPFYKSFLFELETFCERLHRSPAPILIWWSTMGETLLHVTQKQFQFNLQHSRCACSYYLFCQILLVHSDTNSPSLCSFSIPVQQAWGFLSWEVIGESSWLQNGG